MLGILLQRPLRPPAVVQSPPDRAVACSHMHLAAGAARSQQIIGAEEAKHAEQQRLRKREQGAWRLADAARLLGCHMLPLCGGFQVLQGSHILVF